MIGSCVKIPKASAQDKIQSWYMRLSHISEREIIVLSQRGLLRGQQVKS